MVTANDANRPQMRVSRSKRVRNERAGHLDSRKESHLRSFIVIS